MHCTKPFDRSLLDSAITLAETYLNQENEYIPFYWNFFIQQYNAALLVDLSTHINEAEKAYKRLMFSIDILRETSCKQLLSYLVEELDHINLLSFTKDKWLSLINEYVLAKTYLADPDMAMPEYDLLLCDNETLLKRLERLYRTSYTYRGIPWDNHVLFENGYGWNDGDGLSFTYFNAYYTSPTEVQFHWLFDEPHLDPFHIYVSQSPFNLNNLPTPIASIDPSNSIKGYTATGLTEGSSYYFAVGTTGADGYVLSAVINEDNTILTNHFPLIDNLSDIVEDNIASFERASSKYVIEGELLQKYEEDAPVFLDGYLDLPVKGLMLEQQETNWMKQSSNVLASPWVNLIRMGCSVAPAGISPSDTLPAFKFDIQSAGLDWGHGRTQPMASGIEYVHSAMFRAITPGKTAAMGRLNPARQPRINGVNVPLPTGSINSTGDRPLGLVRDIQIGEWRYVEGRRSYSLGDFRDIGYLGHRNGSWSYYGFGMTMQERFYSSKIFTGPAIGIRAADILTIPNSGNKISFDFQYMPQGHSTPYQAISLNNGEISISLTELSSTSVRLIITISGQSITFDDIEIVDLSSETFTIELSGIQEGNVSIVLNANDYNNNAYISNTDPVLSDDFITVQGWAVISNFKIYGKKEYEQIC